jgi:cell division septum initiation protein DivIVA
MCIDSIFDYKKLQVENEALKKQVADLQKQVAELKSREVEQK